VKAVEISSKMTPEIDKKIEDLLKNQPVGGLNWKLGKPEVSRRAI